jgi:hypothetical protein
MKLRQLLIEHLRQRWNRSGFLTTGTGLSPRGKKRIVGSRDYLYPRIANGSSVSYVSPMDPLDPPYPRYIFYILIVLPTSPVVTTYSNCILISSQVLYCGVPLGLQVLYYRDTLGFSSTILWE